MTQATALSPGMPTPDAFSGELVRPGDPEWDNARSAFNLLVDQRPVAVAFPADERDIIALVRHARQHGLRIAAQATGHNAGPLGDLSGTILVNVSRLDEVRIDVDARTVRVGAGVTWQHVTPELSRHGLAALHGSSPDVGIAGYSLGGGIGWLARSRGMQTNSVLAFELVTADGHMVRTDAVHEPDLFWALRGGGGNFGVVTAIEFAVYPHAELYAGALFFPFERASTVLHAWRDLLPSLPEEMTTWAALLHFPPAPDVPEPLRGGSFTVVWGVHAGSESEGQRLMAPIRDLAPDLDTFAMVAPAELGDLAMDPRDPLPMHSAHDLLEDWTAQGVDDLLAVVGPGAGRTVEMVQLRHLGGAVARRTSRAGARATLPGEICVFSLGVVPDQVVAEQTAATLQAIRSAVSAFRVGDYPNFVETPSDASAFFDAETWQRLRAIKALYDPTDLFRANHVIPPAT